VRRRTVLLVLLAAAAGCATTAFASDVGGVSSGRLTVWSGPTSIPASSCSSGPTQDSYVDSQHRNNSHGGESNLDVIGSSTPTYTLIQFAPCAPSNALVLTAGMSLYLRTSPGAGRSYDVYPMTASWSENTSWSASGGAISGTAVATATTGGSGSTISWSLTSQVQAIVSGGTNNGWAIGDQSTAFAQGSFDSREGANTPSLALTYYP